MAYAFRLLDDDDGCGMVATTLTVTQTPTGHGDGTVPRRLAFGVEPQNATSR